MEWIKISIRNEDESERRNNDVKLERVPKILPLPNGSLYSLDNLKPMIVESLQNSRGEILYNIRGIVLCRCGASKNKPFCDGSHNSTNFMTK
jgi:CDGSH-type Zn-finger protein